MNEAANNQIFTVVTPPSLYIPKYGPKLFIAGSISGGKAPNWQQDIIDYIEKTWIDEELTIYNPRRKGKYKQEMEIEQAAWSISMLNVADYILLHLIGEGGSPITTLELGMFINSPKLFVSIDDSYTRKEIVEIHYNAFGTGQMTSSPMHSVELIKAHWYRKKLGVS